MNAGGVPRAFMPWRALRTVICVRSAASRTPAQAVARGAPKGRSVILGVRSAFRAPAKHGCRSLALELGRRAVLCSMTAFCRPLGRCAHAGIISLATIRTRRLSSVQCRSSNRLLFRPWCRVRNRLLFRPESRVRNRAVVLQRRQRSLRRLLTRSVQSARSCRYLGLRLRRKVASAVCARQAVFQEAAWRGAVRVQVGISRVVEQANVKRARRASMRVWAVRNARYARRVRIPRSRLRRAVCVPQGRTAMKEWASA